MTVRFASAITLIALLLPVARAAADDAISFSRQIQPILARKCFACHGPDEDQRQADLRLDQRDSAQELGAIVPGEPDESELLRRVAAEDPDERMPPIATHESVTAAEQELLRRWIEAGAPYEAHWAFVAPIRPPLPRVADAGARNPIDRLVFEHLQQHGLQPAPPADRYTLVRRLYLDLIGLPPTPAEADRFVHDGAPDAYERLVDHLLHSPAYGERWARDWLDLARYSDTNGYEKDRPRSIWPYRDWVVEALNADLPFDQFTVEQLAGDMLPEATASQRIATGFHRNTMLNEEGGIDPLEYRFYAMVDRVATVGTIWLGLTTGCAQCHSHKFDPISHTDYYRFMALLNNADEPDLSISDPRVMDERRRMQQQIAELEKQLESQFPPAPGDGPVAARRRENFERRYAEWLASEQPRALAWNVLRPIDLQTNLPRLEMLADGSIFSTGDITKRDVFRLVFEVDNSLLPITALRLEVLPDDRLPAGGPGRAYYEGRQGDFFLSEATLQHNDQRVPLVEPSHSYGRISIGSGTADAKNVIDREGSTGWSTAEREGEAHQWVVNLERPIAEAGRIEIEMLFERHFAASLGRFRWSAATAPATATAKSMPVEIESILARTQASWTEDEQARVRGYLCLVAPELADARRRIDQLRRQLPPRPSTLVMLERPADNPRATFRHHRGEYLSPREEVTPGVPAIFPPLPHDQPANRLTLARWLVSDANPLVARVAVNRAWQTLFGTGLVASSGDLGTQSDPPSHPKLLDWLACEFVDQGWSLKKLHRLIVTSRTYQQASDAGAEAYRLDPNNRHLARGPRLRLDAETIRDSLLAASGRITCVLGGPGVYPPQPPSVTALAYGEVPWKASAGPDRYRRSLYTFSKRTAPFAAFAVFDAPSGEVCVTRRDRSNTPLQALTLLNDEMFLELSRGLAQAARDRHRESELRCVNWMFRRVLIRPPRPEESTALLAFYRTQLRRLEEGALSGPAILGQAASEQNPPNEVAAWAMVARAIMNLDEAITRP